MSCMELKSKWVVVKSLFRSSAGCCTAVNWLMSYSLGTTTMPPGCWPVVFFTPTQPATSRSFSVLPA